MILELDLAHASHCSLTVAVVLAVAAAVEVELTHSVTHSCAKSCYTASLYLMHAPLTFALSFHSLPFHRLRDVESRNECHS